MEIMGFVLDFLQANNLFDILFFGGGDSKPPLIKTPNHNFSNEKSSI